MVNVFTYLKLTRFTLLTLVLLQLAACGGKSGPNLNLDSGQPSGQHPLSIQELALSDAIAEIQASTPPVHVEAGFWEKLTNELAMQLSIHAEGKIVSAAPGGEQNSVADLAMVDDGAGGFNLEWTYLNVGDYDWNSEVNLADITPIALYFMATSADANWDSARLADGDGNGEVNLADISPIAINFMSQVYAYEVQGSYLQNGPWDAIDQLTYTPPPGIEPQTFSYPLGAGGYSTYSVVPVDSAGAEGVHSILVTAAPVRLASPLAMSEDSGFTTMDIDVVFSIGLAESIGVPISAELVEVDSEGNQLAVLGNLWDDGDPLHGDEFAGDSTLSFKLNINRALADDYYFRANITFDNGGSVTIASNTVALQLLEEIADERIDEILAQLDVFTEQLDNLRDPMEPGLADTQMVEILLADPGISEAGRATNNEGVWYKTSDGIGCGISYPDPLVYGSESETSAASAVDLEISSTLTNDAYEHLKQVSNLNPDIPQRRKLLILDPFQFDFLPFEGGKELKELLTPIGDAGCKGFPKIDYFKNEECSLDKFEDMSEYGAIIIISHGKLYHMTDPVNPWEKQLILTGTEIPKGTTNLPVKLKYRVQENYVKFQSLKLRSGETKKYLAFDQRFLEYSKPLQNSFVFLAVCHSGEFPGLADSFTNIGAQTVYGFDNSVSYPFAIDVCKDLFTGLREGKDTSNVFGAIPQLMVEPYNKSEYTPPGTPNNHVKLVKVQNPANKKQAWWTNPYVKVSIDTSKGSSPVLYDINNNGLVVGTIKVEDGPNQVAVWQINADNTTTCTLVGSPTGNYITPSAINDSGLIVANSQGHYHYGLYYEGPDYQHYIELDDFNLHGFNSAEDINNSGKVTGTTRFGPPENRGPYKAMSYQGGAFTDLGELPAIPGWQIPDSYKGTAINNSSVIVGQFESQDLNANLRSDAFIYFGGQMRMLPTVGGILSSFTSDINDEGWVVGYVAQNAILSKGYIWNSISADEHYYLPKGDGYTFGSCIPSSINSKNQIVGSVFHVGDQAWHAALLERSEFDPDAYILEVSYNIYDLNCLSDGSHINRMEIAKKINDHGQIIGKLYGGDAFIIVPGVSGS